MSLNAMEGSKQQEPKSQESTPLPSLDVPDDYSDLAPEDVQDPSTAKRKHQRGGRKAAALKTVKRKSTTRIPPLLPADINPDDSEPEESADKDENVGEEQAEVGDTSKLKQPEPTPPSKKSNPFETGIRAFNLKKAQASGGQPVKVRPQRRKSSKKNRKAKKQKDKKHAALDESDVDSEESSSDEEEGKQDEVSIRLDLNLVVEIFLKAKIKGDVTITFLQ